MYTLRYPVSILGSAIALSLFASSLCAQSDSTRPGSHASTQSRLAPTITSQMQFKIPLAIGSESQNLVEVILHQSIDEGETWKVYQRLAPSADGFNVDCDKEGEFQFALQTRDRNGRLHPPDIRNADLIIVVDTSRPEFDFDVHPDAAGRIVGQWSANDPNLDPESLVIEYQSYSAQNDQWIQVPTTANELSNPSVYQDQLAWWPETASRSLLIKASIGDRAGNRTELSRQMLVPQTAHRPAPTRLASATSERNDSTPDDPNNHQPNSQGNTEELKGYQRSGVPAALATMLPQNSVASGSANSNDKIARNTTVNPPNPGSTQQRPIQIPDGKTSPATAIQTNFSKPSSPDQGRSSATTQSWPSTDKTNVHRDRSVVSSTQTTANPSNEAESGSQWKPRAISDSNLVESVGSTTGSHSNHRATSGNSITDRGGGISAAPTAGSVLMVGSELQNLKSMSRPCSSTLFQLQYSIDAIGPDGVKTVELWMTPDGGQNWRRMSNDEDRRSPVDVEVPSEGIYGFRIVVISNDGLRTRPPKRGDAADVWVNVDSTVPVVNITSAPFGKNEDLGKLVIQWSARDANLHMRPISLQYSSQINGPWTTIEEGVRNTGSYAWKPTKDIPERIYLRIQARDEAGNIGTYETDRPIDISGLIPRGHIKGIIPIPKPDT